MSTPHKQPTLCASCMLGEEVILLKNAIEELKKDLSFVIKHADYHADPDYGEMFEDTTKEIKAKWELE